MRGESQKLPRCLPVVIIAASAVTFAGLLTWALLVSPAPAPMQALTAGVPASGIIFKVLAAPLVTAWCYSACRRCTDRFVQRCLACICALCLFWILDTLLKYPARDDGLVQLLWYLFYIPIIFIPLLCSYLALHLARGGTGKGFPRYQAVSFAVSCALLAMVLTNGQHHFVFVFDGDDPHWGSGYGYGPGYLVVVSWVVGLVATCPAALLYAARRSLRRAIAFLLVPLALIGAYALCYALRVPAVFSSSVAMMDTLFIIVTFEAALRLGLVPVQQRQREVFSRLPFELKVFDDEGELRYATDAALRDTGFGMGGSHRHCETVPLSSGHAVAVKDTTLVDEKSAELDEMRTRLERQRALLEAEYGVEANVRVQQELENLYDEVASSVSRGVERACSLLDELAAQGDDAGTAGREGERGARWRTLAEVKLLLGLCKQKGQCVVDARRSATFAGDYLRLAMMEACANARPLGIECAVLLEVEGLSAQELLMLLDELYAWSIAALGDETTVVARVAGEEGRSSPRLRMMVERPRADDALARRKQLGRELGMSSAETALRLEGTALSVSVLLGCRGGAP